MKTYMFPGQGSQAKGMGGTLFDEFADLTKKADQILGYSIKELCLDNPKRELNKTQFTQPALYVVNALTYYKKIQETGRKPDYVAGHSLGEFNALLAAECFDFETGLRLVQKRGELMSQAPEGGMAAILNASKEHIESTLEKHGLFNIDIANYNTPSQIVISGSIEEIGKAQEFFQGGEVLYYPLNTSGAFHSRFMQPAKEKFAEFLQGFSFSELKIPVMSNVTAEPYKNTEIVQNLANQLSSGVRWSGSIQYLMALADKDQPMEFEEIGNGDVLTKIFRTIQQETTALAQNLSVEAEQPDPRTDKPAAVAVTAADKTANATAKPAKSLAAEEKAKAWNLKYPVGTKVKSTLLDYADLETRTAALVLFGHRAAVYMKNYNGYFDLDEVTPV